MNAELEVMRYNQVLDLNKLPSGQKAIVNKYIFKLRERKIVVDRHKSRLVSKRYSQEESMDC